MRLKSLRVRNAGPIGKLDAKFGDVNLIVGNNEEGKTTLTDILIRALFRKKTGYNKQIWNERFDLDGLADIETEGNPPAEDALKHSSLYVIREGDMRWQGRSAKNEMLSREMWNEDIREILYGSDEVYSKISRKAVELMGIAPGKGWMQKLVSNIDELRRTTDAVLSRVEEYKANESGLAEDRRLLADNERKMTALTEARKVSASMLDRELIDRFFKKTDELQAARAEREKLEKKDLRRTLQEWNELEREITRIEREISRLDAGKASLEERRKEKSGTISSLRKKADALGELLRNIDLELRKKNIDLENEKRNFARDMEKWTGKSRRTVNRVLVNVLLFFILSFAVTAAGATLAYMQFNPLTDFLLPFLVGCIVSLTCSILVMTVRLVRNSAAARGKRGLEEERLPVIRDMEYQIRIMAGDLERTRADAEELAQETEKTENELTDMDTAQVSVRLDQLKNELEEKKSSLGGLVRVHQSYQNAVQEAGRMEMLEDGERLLAGELGNITAKIRTKFGNDSVTFLKEELKRLHGELEKAGPEAHYNEEQFEKLSLEKDAIGERVFRRQKENEKIRAETLTLINEGLGGLTRDVRKEYADAFYSETASFGLDGDIFNIFAFRERLEKFSEKVRQDAKSAGEFLKVMDRVQSDVQSLIGSVVNTDAFRDSLSRLTNGRYEKMDAAENDGALEFRLVDRDGNAYPLRNLSTGTRNQVYFAVRLSLAKNFLTGERGVFLLDDAFLTFDEGRRRSALELLAGYAEDGWQIIYSSVNEKNMEGLFDDVFGKKLVKITLSEETIS